MRDSQEEAAAGVVVAKNLIDAERRAAGEQPVWPGAFIQYAFPFASDGAGASTATIESVPAELVIGARWGSSWDTPPSGDDAEALCDRLDQLALDHSAPNWAILVRVGELPLWYALEGKNRVELYRALGRPLIAESRQSSHPDPQELVVRRGNGVVGVSRAAHPQVTSPLPVPEVGDLLIAAGAKSGPPLEDRDVPGLTVNAQRRKAFLDYRW